MSRSTPPKPDELEISVIGPGRGESILLHLGGNDWCVVDSCVARGGSEPAALEYLKSLGNDALRGIKLVIATHWHDDHIGGLASLLRVAPNARFACSMALKSSEFQTLVSVAPNAVQGRSGVDELAAILDILIGRAEARAAQASPMFAIENRRLLHLADAARPFPVSVTALSPSDGSVKAAMTEIGSLIPRAGELQRRIINRSPNRASVVLWVEAGATRALLGADLEHTGRAGEGWTAVVAARQDRNRAVAFKVAHHGSAGSDCPDVWTKMLAENPIAVVTLFSGGPTRLPKTSDIDRLAARTPFLYCTAAGPGKPPSRGPAIERVMKRQVVERRVIEGKPGHVRIRWPVPAQAAGPRIETFNGAYSVVPKPTSW